MPLVRGIENLDAIRSAECMEHSLIIIGIFLVVPLTAPEQPKEIQEIVYTKRIPQWAILSVRLLMSVFAIAILTSTFAGIMVWSNCTFPYMRYVIGTIASTIALGSVGLFASIFSNSTIIGYLVSIGYFLVNLLGSLLDETFLYLFSMENGEYMTKWYLVVFSFFIIAIALLVTAYKAKAILTIRGQKTGNSRTYDSKIRDS